MRITYNSLIKVIKMKVVLKAKETGCCLSTVWRPRVTVFQSRLIVLSIVSHSGVSDMPYHLRHRKHNKKAIQLKLISIAAIVFKLNIQNTNIF